MPASLRTFPSAINVRDFVDDVGPDPVRPTAARSLQLYTELNIPYDENLLSDDVKCERIPTYVRCYLSQDEKDFYVPDVFFYAWGNFITYIKEDKLEILINAYELNRCVLACLPYSTPVHVPSTHGLIYVVILETFGTLKSTKNIVHVKRHRTS